MTHTMKKFWYCLVCVLVCSFKAIAQDTIFLEKYLGDLKKTSITIGNRSYSFLFDTGGGETFISPAIAKALGKTVYGNTVGFRMSGEMVRYQKCDSIYLKCTSTNTTLFHPSIGVWDVMSLLPKDLPALDGVLSLKSFQDKIITLDLANNRIVLETPLSYHKQIKNKTLLQSRFANGPDGNELTVFLGITRNDRLYWLLFDSGNIGAVLLSYNSVSEWGLKKDTIDTVKIRDSLKIMLDKKQITTVAETATLIYDGALNYSVLSGSIFIINFPEKKVWMY